MKKIIGGKRYDTESAKELAFYQNSNRSDFNFWIETLYQKRTGEYFLYGEGGPLSKYAESAGMNEWTGGEMIIPLSFKKAQEWAEEYLDGDEYEKIFGKVGEEKKATTLSLSSAATEKAKQKALEAGVSMSEYIENLILNF